MKKTATACILAFISLHTMAQVIQPPPVKSGQKAIPANLKPVTKANLTITGVSVLSATGGNDRWDIRLAVTIKNSGGMAAPASKIKALAQNAAATSNPWKELAIFELAVLNPGAVITKEFHILDKAWVMHKIPVFNLKLLADFTNSVDESSENDNESSVIRVSDTR
ncbi:MAG: CARDB domain-containing protein [Ferruginibacter sp.]